MRAVAFGAGATRPASSSVPFVVVGTLCVVGGGLLAAATASAPTEHSTWAAAYLVLVGGVAQAGLGVGQGLCGNGLPTPLVAVLVIGWNLGNAAVLVGALGSLPRLADAGAAVLIVTLIMMARGITAASRVSATVPRWFRYCYGLLIAVLFLSVPVGLVLLHLRA